MSISRILTIHRRKEGRYTLGTSEEYYLSDSASELVGGEWSDEFTYRQGKYVWTRTKYEWSDGSPATYSEPKLNEYMALLGTKMTYIGEDGIYTGTLSADIIAALKISAENITAGTLSAEVGLQATKGTIGGFTIEGDRLSNQGEVFFNNDDGCGYLYEFYMNNKSLVFTEYHTFGICYTGEDAERKIRDHKGMWEILKTVIDREGISVYRAYFTGQIFSSGLTWVKPLHRFDFVLEASYGRTGIQGKLEAHLVKEAGDDFKTVDIDGDGIKFSGTGEVTGLTEISRGSVRVYDDELETEVQLGGLNTNFRGTNIRTDRDIRFVNSTYANDDEVEYNVNAKIDKDGVTFWHETLQKQVTMSWSSIYSATKGVIKPTTPAIDEAIKE